MLLIFTPFLKLRLEKTQLILIFNDDTLQTCIKVDGFSVWWKKQVYDKTKMLCVFL